MRIVACLTSYALVLCALAQAQTPASPSQPTQSASAPERFEVASIRPADRNTGLAGCVQFTNWPSNRFTMHCASLNTLVDLAYGSNATQGISGGANWVRSQDYSVTAKVEGSTLLSWKQMQPLLQNLLAERFHLKIHRERRIVPGYALIVASAGAKLQPTKGGAFMGIDSICDLKTQNISVGNFGRMLQRAASLGKPVVDKTDLDGMYDIELKYFADENPHAEGNPTCAHVPDIFTAVQEQLGLKLVPQKVPVDYLLIDHADQPTEN